MDVSNEKRCKNNLNDKYKKYNKIRRTPMGVRLIIFKNTIFVNESGLFYVPLKSEKPISKIFSEKLTFEIMLKIRETRKYIVNGNEQNNK